MKTLHVKTEKGFALLLAMLVSSVVLAIGVSILHVSVSQINLASNARESEIAFGAAHAGADCMWYWRIVYSDEYTDGDLDSQEITCFSEDSDSTPSQPNPQPSSSDGTVDLYSYEFSWGSNGGTPDRCTQIDMYVMDALSTGNGIVYDFTDVNDSIGGDGTKDCEEGSVCTVIVSRGYNDPACDSSTSIFTIQRELTVEL